VQNALAALDKNCIKETQLDSRNNLYCTKQAIGENAREFAERIRNAVASYTRHIITDKTKETDKAIYEQIKKDAIDIYRAGLDSKLAKHMLAYGNYSKLDDMSEIAVSAEIEEYNIKNNIKPVIASNFELSKMQQLLENKDTKNKNLKEETEN